MDVGPEASNGNTTDVEQLQRRFIEYRDSVYREGLLDEGFQMLMKMADADSPDFSMNVLFLFCEASHLYLTDLANELGKPDSAVSLNSVRVHVSKLRVGSVSVGAKKLTEVCDQLWSYCRAENVDRCRRFLPRLREEYVSVRSRLERLSELGGQIVAAGGLVPSTD